MNILNLNPFFYPYMGGTEKVIHQVGKRLSKKHRVTVLTAQLENAMENETIDGIEVIRLPAKIFYKAPHPLPPPVPILKDVNKMLEKLLPEYDIVHVHNRFVYNMTHAHIVKKHGKKLCLTLHNSRPHNIDPITDLVGSLHDDTIGKQFMNMCDGIVAVSKATMEETVPSGYKGIKRAIHNGVDPDLFCPGGSEAWKEKLGIQGRVVLTNVRLVQQKGVEYLLDAMNGIDADLVVFGRGPLLEKLKKMAGPRTHFVTERISDSELVELYRSADCFVLPSLYEPGAVALMEAMGCGLPIVATDVGGDRELIEHNGNGFIVPARNAKAIHDSVHKILNDSVIAKKFSIESRKRVIDHFNWGRAAEEYELFYIDVMAQPR